VTITMTLRLDEDLACRVRLVARLEGVSQAEIARRSLRRYTGHKLRDGDADERLERLHGAERRRLDLNLTSRPESRMNPLTEPSFRVRRRTVRSPKTTKTEFPFVSAIRRTELFPSQFGRR